MALPDLAKRLSASQLSFPLDGSHAERWDDGAMPRNTARQIKALGPEESAMPQGATRAVNLVARAPRFGRIRSNSQLLARVATLCVPRSPRFRPSGAVQ